MPNNQTSKGSAVLAVLISLVVALRPLVMDAGKVIAVFAVSTLTAVVYSEPFAAIVTSHTAQLCEALGLGVVVTAVVMRAVSALLNLRASLGIAPKNRG